jgi:hypothetical protein
VVVAARAAAVVVAGSWGSAVAGDSAGTVAVWPFDPRADMGWRLLLLGIV